MNTGSAFYIGKTHKICQDYTLHGIVPEPYIIVSDGCSGSPNTDYGSRILAKVASDLISSDGQLDSDELLIEADEVCRILNMPQHTLDATLLCAYKQDKNYHLHMFGDGIAVKIKEDNTMEVISINYPSGAPYYLSYRLNETRKEGYIEQFSLKKEISKFNIYSDGIVENFKSEEDDSDEHYLESGLITDYKAIILMSDGIHTFYELNKTPTFTDEKPIKLIDVLKKVLDFKGWQGEFLDRRFTKFRKECEKINWHHGDDFSLAAMYFGEEK
jgi:sulfur transfer complex TusBCD TusB component (DsrH family)